MPADIYVLEQFLYNRSEKDKNIETITEAQLVGCSTQNWYNGCWF